MISRRTCVATGLTVFAAAPAAGATSALPIPASNRIAFRLMRNGSVIGSHTLDFAIAGDVVTIKVAIDILVKFGPVPVYRYKHRATEIWRGGTFNSIESVTDRDGTSLRMRAEVMQAGLTVEGSQAPRYIAPANTYPTTYWNRVMLQNNVINSEDGRLFEVKPKTLAEESVPSAAGSLRARHYRLEGDLPLDLWYDDNEQWAHLVFTKDGSTVIYQKL